MFDEYLFKVKVKTKGFTLDGIAAYLGINPATLTRKMNGSSDFTRNEIELLKQKLSLNINDVDSIFFAQKLA